MGSRRIFGTDGVRGAVGEFLSAELAMELASAATEVVRAGSSGPPQVLVLRDTRVSGDMLEGSVAAGITSAGGDALLAGVLPTPAAPLLLDKYDLSLAVVISASHNPYQDNGIKFFGPDGLKLSDEAEFEIEKLVTASTTGRASTPGRIHRLNGAGDDYLRALASRFDVDLSGKRIVLDCANGSTYRVAPLAFERLGATVSTIGTDPDGKNINAGIGSTHTGPIAERVVQEKADLGFAFDGDGDRVLGVDRHGQVVDGDELMALAALHLRDRGELAGNGIAVTVMSNYGFHRAMEETGIDVATTKVGDRYVLEELKKRQWSLGGEQSGHIINLGFNPTGDGVASALLALEALAARKGDLQAGTIVKKLPQRLESLPVQDRDGIERAARLWEAVDGESKALEGKGRVLVRPSGTEPVVRVMVEAPTAEECDAVTERLSDVVRRELGS